MTQAEIADRQSVTLSGAKSKVQRRRQLEKLLRGSCEIELDRRGDVIECKPASGGWQLVATCRCSESR